MSPVLVIETPRASPLRISVREFSCQTMVGPAYAERRRAEENKWQRGDAQGAGFRFHQAEFNRSRRQSQNIGLDYPRNFTNKGKTRIFTNRGPVAGPVLLLFVPSIRVDSWLKIRSGTGNTKDQEPM